MNVVVAGASGVVGSRLVPLLVGAGHDVTGLTRDRRRAGLLRSLGAQPAVVDIYDREALALVLDRARPNVVVHQLTDLRDRSIEMNSRMRVVGTRNLVDASFAAGVERIIAQSIAWAYAPGDDPAKEDESLDCEAAQPRRQTIDGVIALETAAGKLPHAVVLRYGRLYGPGTWYAADGPIADDVRKGSLTATEDVTSFIHVEDAARAALAALDWPSGPVNIVDDEPAAGSEWLPVYAQAIGAPPPSVVRGRSPTERGASNAKARLERGWSPVYPSWRDGFSSSL